MSNNDIDSTARDTGPVSINEWARVQRKLLRLERDEEVEQVAGMINQLAAKVGPPLDGCCCPAPV